MAIVVKRPLAELDLLEIWDYIADNSMDQADEFFDRIEEKLQRLALNPGLGRKRDELLPWTAKLFDWQLCGVLSRDPGWDRCHPRVAWFTRY